MIVKLSAMVVGGMLFLVPACSSQTRPASSSSSPQVASANATVQPPEIEKPSVTDHSITTIGDCHVDLMDVCYEWISLPTITVNGQRTATAHLDEERGVKNERLTMPFRAADRRVIATVECFVRYNPNKVVGARLLPDPPISQEAVNLLKERNLCEPNPHRYHDAIARWDGSVEETK